MNKLTRTLLAALLVCTSSALAQGIAFITNLRGEVAVDGNPRPLILSELAKGQKITVGHDSHAWVMYTATGKEYVLRGAAQYELRDTGITSSTGMPPMARSTEWRTNAKVLTQVAHTSSASVRMRSLAPRKQQEPRAALLYPTEGSIGTLQPLFRWTAGDPKAQAELTVVAAGHDKPVHRALATGDSYRLPAKLKPDTEYAWVVTSAGVELGTGKFRTLPAEAIRLIEMRRPADKAEFSDRVLFTLLLQEMGAVQEAKESWSRLSQERNDLPELSALAK